jgi:hypothetical protein
MTPGSEVFDLVVVVVVVVVTLVVVVVVEEGRIRTVDSKRFKIRVGS